jgi:uncharacterized RDD family membrane protein YckC
MRILLAGLLLAAAVTAPHGAAAQVIQTPTPIPTPTPAPVPTPTPQPRDPDLDDFGDFGRTRRAAVRIGQDYRLRPGDEVRQAVIIAGNGTIEGRVDRDVVVVFGTARIASTAVIEENLIVIGGSTVIEPGAVVNRDLVVVGGAFDAPPEFMPGGEHVVIGTMMGGQLESLGTWFSRGLLWGRLVVPSLPWIWGVVAVFFVVYLALNIIFERPVRACANTLATRPLTTFGVGLLVLLLVGPISLLLAVSVIGLAVVPFVLCALLAGWVIGKVGVMRWIGMSVLPEDEPDNRVQSVRSFAIGFVLITVVYMIPVLALVMWAIVGVLGLGSAALSFISAYRRENPKPIAPEPAVPPPAPAFVPPPPVPATYQYSEVSSPATEPAAAFEGAPPAVAAAAPAIPLAASRTVLAAMPKALFRDRLAAFVLDIILMVIVVNIFDLDVPESFFVGLLVYHIAFWTWKQTTVGGIICQLRLTRVDGTSLSFADALVRGLASIFSLAVAGIGALWILKDPDNQAWHDKIAGTYVVKVPRNWPL